MNIVDLNEFSRERDFKNCVGQLSRIYSEAGLNWKNYEELISRDFDQAVRRIPEFIEKARTAGAPGGRAYESLAGGPNPDFILPLINGIGRIYPELSFETRKIFTINALSFLDSIRSDYSQNHVQDIEEPWIVRDILLERSLYFPGYINYVNFLKQFRTWEDFNNGLGTEEGEIIRSPFWLTNALIQPKHSSLAVRNKYYEHFGSLVDRTLDAVAALNYEWSKIHVERRHSENKERMHEEIEKGPLFEWGTRETECDFLLDLQEEIESRINDIDPLLHESLRKKIEARNWQNVH